MYEISYDHRMNSDIWQNYAAEVFLLTFEWTQFRKPQGGPTLKLTYT